MSFASAAARARSNLREAVGVLLRSATGGLARASGRRGFGFLAVDGHSDGGTAVGNCDTGRKAELPKVIFGSLR
jgi:hypothetical protein